MKEKKFNQQEYTSDWDKNNMAMITAKYKKEFVSEFKAACKELGLTQSEVIREAMMNTISKTKK